MTNRVCRSVNCNRILISGVCLMAGLFFCGSVCAATLYVWQGSPSPSSPYGDWNNAAHSIQEAVDVAEAGDVVLVTNGTYLLAANISITNAITLASVNGPDVTTVNGQDGEYPCIHIGVSNCSSIIRGFTVTNGGQSGIIGADTTAIITNCTLTGNQTDFYGGGVIRCTLNNCLADGNQAVAGGAAHRSILNHCTLRNNVARYGAGAYDCVLQNCLIATNSSVAEGASEAVGGGVMDCVVENCMIIGNSAEGRDGFAGGASLSTLSNCTISGNYVGGEIASGGGAHGCVLFDCMLLDNSIRGNGALLVDGGGAAQSILSNCMVVGNSVYGDFCRGGGVAFNSEVYNCWIISNSVNGETCSLGGGANDCVIENSVLVGNCAGSSNEYGGGAYDCELRNCTVSGNSAALGGGVAGGTQYNCIVWGNIATNEGSDVYDAEVYYTCASDISAASNGCINTDPLFVDATNGDFSIRADSPCFNTGNNAYAPTNTPYDLAGNPRIMVNTVDMGAFEVRPIYVDVNGSVDGDGTSWATAFTNIQSGVNAAESGDFVWVTNGTYLLASEISMTNSVMLASVNGPGVTVVDGQANCRCVNMSNTASTLSGFTVTHGYTETNGAGVHCADLTPVITNCVIAGNQAYRAGGVHYGTLYDCILSGNTSTWAGGAFYSVLMDCDLVGNSVTDVFASGGGVHSGTLRNCRLISNRVDGAYSTGAGAADSTLKNCLLYNNIASGSYNAGGGTSQGTLNNCTVYSNSAQFGGGASRGILRNCIVWNNSASQDGNDIYEASVWYGCASDVSTASNGCINTDPLFADPANGNYQLQAGSPCMDAGTNMAEVTDDIVGVPRPLDGNNDGTPVTDMGAYEYVNALADSDGDWLPDTNEMANGTSPILADSDGDQMIDGAEIEAGTDPLDTDSFLGMFQGNAPTGTGVVVKWSSVEGKMYNLRRSTNLVESSSVMVMTNVVAIPPLNVVTDTTASVNGPLFYWVELAP